MRQNLSLQLPTVMYKLAASAFTLIFAAAGLAFFNEHANAQGFAFTNGTLAMNNCKAASPDERDAAITLAQAALPRTPHPMIHLHTDGLLPHQGARDESVNAERDWDAARDLAVGYCVTGDAVYLTHTEAILSAWIKTYQPDFNPGDEANFEQLFLAADIIDSAMPAPLLAQWQGFAARLSAGYLAEIDRHAADADNRQSTRIKLATMAAYVVADTAAIGHLEAAFTAQLNNSVQSDGSTADYAKRDALYYVVRDLQPMVTAALAAHDHGENWYGITAPSGVTLQSALAWLNTYATGADTHQEFMRSGVAYDFDRRNAGLEGFSGTWTPSGSAQLYLYASALDRRWADLALQLGGTPKLWQRLAMGMS